MKKMMLKRTLLLLLTLTLVVGVVAPFAVDADKEGKDFAPPGLVKKGFTPPGLAKKGVVIQLTFNDLKDVEWALQYIESMYKQNIFNGYEDGTFRPNSPITHVEAVVAAVRLLGLEDEAKAKVDTSLNFTDAKEITKKYPWATGYVAVALEQGLFDSTVSKLQPEKAASRLWITTLLVRALDLEAEALAKMNTTLTFRDAASIPAGAVGYVAVAIEEGLIQGYPDNTFQPNKPVTRAEMAALLDRTGETLEPVEEEEEVITGIVKALKRDSITIEAEKKTNRYQFADNLLVFRDTRLVTVDDIQVGDEVVLHLYKDQVRFIEIEKSALQSVVYDGQFVALTSKDGKTWLGFKVKNITYEYAVSPLVELKLDDGMKLKDLEQGDLVRVTVTDKKITKVVLIEAGKNSQRLTGEWDGSILAYQLPTKKLEGSLLFRIEDRKNKSGLDGEEYQFVLNRATRLEVNDEEMELAKLDDYIELVEKVEVKVKAGVVQEIELEVKFVEPEQPSDIDSITGEYKGKIVEYQLPTTEQAGYLLFQIQNQKGKQKTKGNEVKLVLTGSTQLEVDDQEMELERLADFATSFTKVEVEVEKGYVKKIELDD